MQYNVDYHEKNDKRVDSQSLSQWRSRYLDGLTPQEWCERSIQLIAHYSNPKVIRKKPFMNNNDCSSPRKLFQKIIKMEYEKECRRRNSLGKAPDCLRGPIPKQ